MTTAYLWNVQLTLACFYLFYRLCCGKDTFFGWRRALLMGSYLLATIVPLIHPETWVHRPEAVTAISTFYGRIPLPEVVITAQEASVHRLTHWLLLIYAAGASYFLLRIGGQLAGLFRMYKQSRKEYVDGTPVFVHPRHQTPFSFFRWIFLHPERHTPDELDEILAHERTHVRQLHSLDVLVSHVVTALCWFNPFAWLLQREVSHNLEYLADHSVLTNGHDQRHYQHLLLALTYPKAAANLYNNFNVSPLKKRILMMNKERTHGTGRLKYLAILPLTALLAIGSRTESTAGTPSLSLPIPSLSLPAPSSPTVQAKDTLEVCEVVDVQPKFPGGEKNMFTFIGQNIKYPPQAIASGKQGRVVVTFIVTKEGHVRDATVLRSVDPLLDAEAIRVVQSMPEWEPGRKKGGEAVDSRLTIPVSFALKKVETPKKEQ